MTVVRMRRAVLTALCCVLVAGAALANLPHNPLSPRESVRLVIRSFSPQGWAFFTRDPRLPQYHFFQRGSGGQLAPLDFRPFRLEHAFGVRKEGRIVSELLAKEAERAPAELWHEDKAPGGPFPPSERVLRAARLFRVSASPLLENVCGELWVKRQAQVPWGYRKRPKETLTKAAWLRMEVVCGASL